MRNLLRFFVLLLGYILHHNHKSKILYYHDVFKDKSYKSLDSDTLMGTPISIFRQHVEIIKKEGFRIVPKIGNAFNEVAIMFDDGFRGIWDNRSFFIENKIYPTVFLAPELIGKEGFLKIEEVLELQEKGFVFESHSWNHVDLTKCSDVELVKELEESKDWLSNVLSKEITSICLPLGCFSPHLISKIRDCGYRNIYSSIPGAYSEYLEGSMRRRNLCQFASPLEFKMILEGGYSFFEKRYMKLHRKSDKARTT